MLLNITAYHTFTDITYINSNLQMFIHYGQEIGNFSFN